MSDDDPEAEARRKLVNNERAKLGATMLNTLATASMTVGVLAPTAAYFYGLNSTGVPVWQLALGLAVWVFVAAGLHYGAQKLLGRLRP